MKAFFKWVFMVAILKRILPLRRRAPTQRAEPGNEADPAPKSKRHGWKRWLKTAAGLLVLLGIGGFLLAASGIVPIKASSGHWGITRWFLEFSKSRSVSTHTIGIKVPALDSPAQVLKGAGHYEIGCAPCHGSPHRPQPRVVAGMLPTPPNLKFTVAEWDTEELFYIVKHGLKFTGMPAWPSLHRDDEVWAMVAFLRKLPELTPDEYRHLASGETALPEGPPIENLQAPKDLPRAVSENCARCHGSDGLGRGMGAFPKLAGQKLNYLVATLDAYAGGDRHSGIMGPIAAGLDRETMEEVSRYYAQLPPDNEQRAAVDRTDSIARGKVIALRGLPDQGIPACVECHGHGSPARNPVYPLLAGQYSDYLVLQLELFQKKQRGGTPYAHLMHLVAKRLSAEQMQDVALYWASVTHDEHSGTGP